MASTVVVVLFLISWFFFIVEPFPNAKEYMKARRRILAAENASYLGADIVLTDQEQMANQYLMSIKDSELRNSFQSGSFSLAENLLESLPQIRGSKVFQFLQKMPKRWSPSFA